MEQKFELREYETPYTTHSFKKEDFPELNTTEIRVGYLTETGCPDGYFDMLQFNDVFKNMLTAEQMMKVAGMKKGKRLFCERYVPKFVDVN